MSVTYGNYRQELESSNVFVKSFYDSDAVGISDLQIYCELCYLHFLFSKLLAIWEEQNNLPVPMQYAGFAMYLLKCNGHWFPLWESLIFYNTCKVAYQFCTYLKPRAKSYRPSWIDCWLNTMTKLYLEQESLADWNLICTTPGVQNKQKVILNVT